MYCFFMTMVKTPFSSCRRFWNMYSPVGWAVLRFNRYYARGRDILMSRLGETILKSLVARRRRGNHSQAQAPGAQDWEAYIQWQFESSARLFNMYPNWNITDR